jgi:hypothetical protein
MDSVKALLMSVDTHPGLIHTEMPHRADRNGLFLFTDYQNDPRQESISLCEAARLLLFSHTVTQEHAHAYCKATGDRTRNALR